MELSTLTRRAAAVVVGAVVLALAPQAAAQAAGGDAISVTGVVDGGYYALDSTTVFGASGTATSGAMYADLVIDGALDGGQFEERVPCSSDGTTCDITFTATTMSVIGRGRHDAYVVLRDGSETALATSSTISFIVGPIVTITSPAASSTVLGSVDIAVEGITDPLGTDTAASFTVKSGATVLSGPTAADCLDPKDCVQTLSAVDISGLAAGSRTITVEMTTADAIVVSDSVSVTVATDPSVAITAPDPSGDVSRKADGSIDFQVSGNADADLGPTTKTVELFIGAGPTGVDTATCSSTIVSCDVTLTWPTPSGTPGSTYLVKASVTVNGVTSSTTQSYTIADAPTVSISTTTVPATLTSIRASGLTDPDINGGLGKTFTLYVDQPVTGTAADTQGCTASPNPCVVDLAYDFTNDPAGTTHDVIVTMTAGGVTVQDTATVTVGSAAVSITSPGSGSTVLPDVTTHLVTVSATASTVTPGATDKNLTLYVDNAATSVTASCTATNVDCVKTFAWDTTGLTPGTSHTIAVKGTVAGVAVDSGQRTVTLAGSPTVTVQTPAGSTIAGVSSITVGAQAVNAVGEKPSTVSLTAHNGIGADIHFAAKGCDSAPVAGACTVTFPWDVTLLSGSYTLTASLTTSTTRTATSAPVGITIGNPPPAVAMTAPAGGSTLKGRVTVSATVSTDSRLQSFPSTLKILADGTQVGPTKTCAAGSRTCSLSFTWDTTTLPNGGRSLQAVATTTTGGAALYRSAPRVVTLANPAPKVTFISPTNADVVAGIVTIKVGLSTDKTQSDIPRSAAIYRNGSTTAFDTFTCSTGTHSCTATFQWDTAKAAGLSTFVVKQVTTKKRVGFSSTSSPRKLYAKSAARITFARSTTVASGTKVTISGRVVAANTGVGVPNLKVAITRDPGFGPNVTGSVTTSSTGRFSVTFTATYNTKIIAKNVTAKSPLGEVWLTSVTKTGGQQVKAPMTCLVDAATFPRDVRGTGSCRVPKLPVGSPLQLRYLYNGTWTTLAKGNSTGEVIAFSFTLRKPGKYQFRVILSGNAVYAGTNSALMPVTIT